MKTKTQTRSSKAPKGRKTSFVVKPDKLTLREWQIQLRKQIAAEEKFGIECVDDAGSPGEYLVHSPGTRNDYTVMYHGENSRRNSCSCLDFKASQLGTCKHIEAVRMWLSSQRSYIVHRQLPPYSSVYMSYGSKHCIKLHIGFDNREEYSRLAAKYFNSDMTLKDDAEPDFFEFCHQARQINNTFRCSKDVIDFIVANRERVRRHKILDGYDDKSLDNLLNATLFPYQKEGILFAARAGKAIIADEMGLGKTIQAIGTAELLRKEGFVGSILILCPTSLKYQWRSEIMRFTNATVEVLEGHHLLRRAAYNSDATYKIVSYNSACNDIKILGSLQTDMLIMDEVQRLKNWNTQISRAARRIQSQYSVILSGTPLENKLEELYSIVEFVDNYRLAPFYKFKNDHIITNESGKVMGYKNLKSIGSRLSDILIRRRKADVKLQMPERMDKILYVPMTDEQRGIHDEFKASVAKIINKWRRMHFLSDVDRQRLLLLLSQMRMVCDSTYILDQNSRHDTKVDEVINLVCDITSEPDEKIVIFSQWERMTRLIAKELDNLNIGYQYLHGGVPSVKRKHLVDKFQNDPDIRVFLSTDAGSTGLNLQSASTIINIDLPWNPAVLEQRIGRIYRIGQRNNIQVINMVAPDSIEQMMIGKLRFKTSMFQGVLDNGDDIVYVDNNKMSQIIETIGTMVESDSDASTDDASTTLKSNDREEVAADVSGIDRINQELDLPDETNHTAKTPDKAVETDRTQDHPDESDGQSEGGTGKCHSDSDVKTDTGGESATSTPAATEPKKLVAQGISFLSGLVETLKSPEATARLVDSIVEKDETTGQTSLRIPVKDKETVANVFSMLASLFSK